MGDGSRQHPTGVINADDVHELTLGTGRPGPQVLAFIAAIQTADADLGTLGWAMTPRRRGRAARHELKVAERRRTRLSS
jgi:hypothetical protein